MRHSNTRFIAATALLLAGIGSSQAAVVCSWRVDGLGTKPLSADRIAQTISRCDLVALQGVARPGATDEVHIALEMRGGSWAQLPPTADSPDKAFLWKRDRIRFAGRALSFPGAGGGYSARFVDAGGQAFALANISDFGATGQVGTLASYVGFMKANYPEDPSRWLIAGDAGVAANDKTMRDLRLRVRPLITGLGTEVPNATLATGDNQVRFVPAAPAGGEPRSQIWAPIGNRLQVAAAGVIAYPGLFGPQGSLGMASEDARRLVSTNYPVYAVVGAVESTGLASEPSEAFKNIREDMFVADVRTRAVVATTCPAAGEVPRSRAVTFPTLDAAAAAGYGAVSCARSLQ